MRAIVCTEYGDGRTLRVGEVPEPECGDGDVLIETAVCALNLPDILKVQNQYQTSHPLPFVPGSELCGTVRHIGRDVTSIEVGDRVCATTRINAFAERVAVPARNVWVLDDTVDDVSGAAFRVTFGTAYRALRSVADVRPQEWIVVLGAAGGVGLAAVQSAALLGARVIAVASSEPKRRACLAEGADYAVDSCDPELESKIKQLTGGGAAVVLDTVGGALSETALRACRWGGRFVTVGFASGTIPAVPLNLVLLKGLTVTGFQMLEFASYAPDRARRDESELYHHFLAGHLRPRIHRIYPLCEISMAVRELVERTAIGKVVLDVRSDRGQRESRPRGTDEL